MTSPKALLAAATALLSLAFLPSPAGAEPLPPAPPGTRIVGGTTAPAGAYPWQVGLVERGTTHNLASCGATILNRSWVLTAAHCVLDYPYTDGNGVDHPNGDYPDAVYGNYVAPSHYEVRTGSVDLRTPVQRLNVASIHPHPEFEWWSYKNDVALLRLARPTTADAVTILTDAESGVLDRAPRTATAIGWGTQSTGGGATHTLRHVDVPLQTASQCRAAYPVGFDPYGEGFPLTYYDANMVCAGATGKDSCQGDSGGPLVTKNGGGIWRQIGIVSFGYECAQPGYPGVYTRVSSVRNFITTTPRLGPFNPDGAAFVRQQYVDFAGRQPTATELANGVSRLKTIPASQFVEERAAAAAWQDNAAMVTRVYAAVFLRNPDTSGLDYWVKQRWAGRGPLYIGNYFAASAEFQQRYGSLANDAFVDLVYTNVFSRPPDPSGRAYWIDKLNSGVGRGQVIYEFSNSPEYRTKTATDVRIITTYFGLMRQVPTAANLTSFRALTQRQLVETTRNSYGYAARFTG